MNELEIELEIECYLRENLCIQIDCQSGGDGKELKVALFLGRSEISSDRILADWVEERREY